MTVAVLAAVFLLVVFWRAAAMEAAYPVERFCRVAVRSVARRIAGAWHGSAASAENARLRRELASVALERGEVERLEAEVDRLRRLLDYATAERKSWLAAPCLSTGGASAPAGTLRIGRGSLDGVIPGAAVVVPEGLVGRIGAVTPHTAVVETLAEGSFKVSCVVETPGGAPLRGILTGPHAGGRLYLRYLPPGAEVPPRAHVVTSGAGGVYPKGIEVGAVISASTDPNGSSVTAVVEPSVDADSLEDVFVRRER